jgi:hypothetical protein
MNMRDTALFSGFSKEERWGQGAAVLLAIRQEFGRIPGRTIADVLQVN